MRATLAQRPRSAPRGFTVIEVLIVLALLLAATALVVPSLGNLLPSARLDHAADQIQSTILTARADAVRDGKPRVISIKPHGVGKFVLAVEVQSEGAALGEREGDAGGEDFARVSPSSPRVRSARPGVSSRGVAPSTSASDRISPRDGGRDSARGAGATPGQTLLLLTEGVDPSAGPDVSGSSSESSEAPPSLPPLEAALRIASVLPDGTIWPHAPIYLSAAGEQRKFTVQSWAGTLKQERVTSPTPVDEDAPLPDRTPSRLGTPPPRGGVRSTPEVPVGRSAP
ncbi:MAG: Tfp pilus assembly protein FimT/FimU [Phycisphaerales bacterium]